MITADKIAEKLKIIHDLNIEFNNLIDRMIKMTEGKNEKEVIDILVSEEFKILLNKMGKIRLKINTVSAEGLL